MIRGLILFLMFLLPVQVFASSIDAQVKLTQQLCNTSASIQQHPSADIGQRLESSQFLQIADAIALQQALSEDCCSFGQDNAEYNLHADLNDEPLPASGFRFNPDSTSPTLAHGHDSVREPPFLPLISPPPRA